MAYKVYIIQRIDTKKIVYVGITKNSLSKRFNAHFSDKRRNIKKVNYFNKYKEFLSIVCIKDFIQSLEEANKAEIFYIKKYRSLGHSLLNATDGGDGTVNSKAWNKGVKCNYVDKLTENSPNAKPVFSYDCHGNFLKQYSSIKKASEETGVSRSAIKNICDLNKRYVMSKGLTFRYYKDNKIEIIRVPELERINNVRSGKIKSAKKVIIIDKLNNKTFFFDNYLDCFNQMNFSKGTLQTYLSISKETSKYKFQYA